ncbi:C4-dicarboxylate transport system (permease large protein) [Pseudooceanicola batsensis HTCC2597]|uniref:TRAP transporter large permease protein n=1 Tax=Pseudooceanicola batsensis (strain ATCC BAA-863 / DSM 15984 / KCTC 12145 / HTCC2597) TaxID=252305 RepID=A3TT40_PSEBH|nr:TRAP transporter large permease [Pseudooceanicola batsensis]EAQ04817.1 C4-dicarboxylate transport system (permease large protein) [Pseudooceanicola batsensis HTCC2597]
MISLSILFGVFFLLLVIGTPIIFALMGAALVVLQANDLLSSQLVLQRIYAGLDSFPMLAIPFFMAAGALMERGGISRRLVNFSSYLVGWIRGGLGHVAVIASTIFAGISGSAVADTTAIGSTMIPMMKRRGFDPAFAASVVAASGVNGPVIPPSIPLVLYGVISGVSIGALFMGGIVPGLMMTVGLMVLIYIKASRGDWEVETEPFSMQGLFRSFLSATGALVMPLIIVGGILGGIFTATEAAVVATVYALIAGLVIYRELTVRQLPGIFRTAALNTAVVMVIVGVANLVGYVLTIEQIPLALSNWFSDHITNALVLLLVINVLLLVAGCFLDGGSAIIVFTPVLLPVTQAFGIDPVFFGVMMTVNLMIGTVTPPVGLSLYIASGIANITILQICRAILPFIAVHLAVLLLITFFPQLVLAIPQALYDY